MKADILDFNLTWKSSSGVNKNNNNNHKKKKSMKTMRRMTNTYVITVFIKLNQYKLIYVLNLTSII